MRRQVIPLSSGTTHYSSYLMWITNLGPDSQVAINQLALYK